ncbi:4-(cytidine 5'-diphospho)-2-C-methyl-D-erythritol kinase [Pseudaminobacter sp. 19-2017]|uniref:4-diphosphocytidyl-2-C-methyl-D-erythritol kinase n=1 Tax=Pseudaminobacter soli (ex Zhang et al. 2022) TaxID=2831468 RepID=A0A942I275_9HYPH|nr:4-(cytidine 5'-diphospho)-2-C-methyl-D-erythritol kinase [Pseudaminobacter soli]MBS3648303.1 4-(cytidine 5'-diphospho)-2-C-methyl-D-erythritol kinase [Pseudaminobacter soli]
MTSATRAVSEAAPAKINLALHVVGRRPDGYHLIESLSVFTAYGDQVAVAPAPHDAFSLAGPFAGDAPDGRENLAVRAREALREVAGYENTPPVLIFLEKNIPAMAGLGGGSSDAAAVLRALTRLWKLDLDGAQLSRIGASLGADVPMCVRGRPLIARGIGEQIEERAGFPVLRMVLVNPRVPVSTPAVFGALKSHDNAPLPPLPQKANDAVLIEWLQATRNDLSEPAAGLAPVIGEALAALRVSGASLARMSGSGATCFGLFPSAAAAERAAAIISKQQHDWFVIATETGGSGGPVGVAG